ncbi:unnamed protein product [Gadus morhua 'NCC']
MKQCCGFITFTAPRFVGLADTPIPGSEVFGEYYHFRHHGVEKRSLSGHRGTHVRLQSEQQVVWAEQQVVKSRRKRDVFKDPTDPEFPKQWYLSNPTNQDLNTKEAWAKGFTGRGVVVTILDDGIEKDHPDLRRNYDPEASYDVNDGDADPQPRYTQRNENRYLCLRWACSVAPSLMPLPAATADSFVTVPAPLHPSQLY